MLLVKNKRFVKRNTVGGAGIFDSITNLFKRLASSNTARSIASNLSKAAASDLGKTAIGAAKTVGTELATSAISAAKDVAIERGKQMINRTKVAAAPALTQKSKDVLAGLISAAAAANKRIPEDTTNINKLMMGQGCAIRIEDLVRKGAGLRLA